MAEIILEIEDKPDGRIEVVGKSSRPLPEDYRDMTGAETIAGRLLVFMKEELHCYHTRLN